jgi:hypothetical protein
LSPVRLIAEHATIQPMRPLLGRAAVFILLLTMACGDGGRAITRDGATPGSDRATPSDGATEQDLSGPGSDRAPGSDRIPPGSDGGPSEDGGTFQPTYGRFGTPTRMFTLPRPTSPDGSPPALYHPELATDFPEVDFQTLDRLYIPAGEYKTILLGGLPERSADRPLVITNLGGQVKVGGQAANYVFSIRGGTNWTLTGRYDPVSLTGDAAFRGHAEGAYAHSQGTYGIFIDDAFSKAGLSGLAIGDRASEFELDTLEVARAEFAGIVAKTDDDGTATMKNVRIHDLYVHDTGSEGIYFGSTQAQPQHAFERLQIHDNRFLRTGTEALQVGQLGSDCEIHHNVLGPAAVRWRSAFARYQDGNVQFGQRYGSSSFHHNIVIGTGDLFVELFPTPVSGDPRAAGDTVAFTDNYFSDTSSTGVYTHADDTGVTIRFERNLFGGFHYNYSEVYPDAQMPVQVFGVGSNSPDPHILKDNVVDGPYPFILYLFPSVTEENNVMGPVPRVRFREFMDPGLDDDYRRLEWWTDRATLADNQPVVVYPQGARVVHLGTHYEALVENQEKQPDQNPDVWMPLPPPADDVRLAPDSPHAGLGVRWPPPP